MKKVHRALEKHHLYCRDCESIINHRQLYDTKCNNHYKSFGHMDVCKNVFSITSYKILHQLADLETRVVFHKKVFLSTCFLFLIGAGTLYLFPHSWLRFISGTIKVFQVVENNLVSFPILFLFLLFLLMSHSAIKWIKGNAAKKQLVAAYQLTSESPLIIKDANRSY